MNLEFSKHNRDNQVYYPFLVVQKSFNMTGLLIKQIESLGMRINIAFVGDKLMKTVSYLENQSNSIRSGANSYLLFHYKPSRLTSLYHYTSIKFEFCDHTEHHHSTQPSLYQNTSFFNANCLYNNNKFAKVINQLLSTRKIIQQNIIFYPY